MGWPFPLVLGLAGSGTVAALGRGGRWLPTRIIPSTLIATRSTSYGAWAEFMLVPRQRPDAARAPAALDLTRAGGVPIVGLTAHETLTDILEVHRGDVVLITAAACGRGYLAVQIASRLGGRVVGTASRRNAESLAASGARP